MRLSGNWELCSVFLGHKCIMIESNMNEFAQEDIFIGVDAGATKTEAVVYCNSKVLGRGVSDGANPHNMSIETAFGNILKAVNDARQSAVKVYSGRQMGEYKVACLGMAGLDTPFDREQISSFFDNLSEGEKTFGAEKLIIVNDGLIGLYSGTNSGNGICLISGTGSNCYGLSKDREDALAGDWGYILGDQGSSYAMGKSILQKVMKEFDGRHSQSTLSKYVLEFLGLKSAEDLVRWTYWHREAPVRQIAALSKICDDVSLSDLVELSEIIDDTVGELVDAYKAVFQRLSFDKNSALDVVLIGGLLYSQGIFAQKVVRSILSYSPRANVVFPNKTPAEGAVKVAKMINQKDLLPKTAMIFEK